MALKEFKQVKGNDPSILEGIAIYISRRTNSLKLRQSESNNSYMSKDILIKLHVHHPTSYSVKFHENQFILY